MNDQKAAGPFEEVVGRLTAKLAGDAELRAEVTNELRGHLEESEREFMAAGRGEAEARAEAIRAIGEEAEVATGLWEGNRRRMRNRRVARWVVGGTLVTGAGVGVVTVAWGAILSLATLLMVAAWAGTTTGSQWNEAWAQRLADGFLQRQVNAMPAHDRLVFEAGRGSGEERLARAKELALAATGDERVACWANYVIQLYMRSEASTRDGKPVYPGAREEVVRALEEGKRMEPRNGFWALAEAAILFEASTKAIDEPEDRQPGFDYVGPDGRKQRDSFDRFEVTDRALYDRAAGEVREAAGAGFIESHAWEFSRMRIGVMPPATRVADEVVRVGEEISILLPYLNGYRYVVNVTGARAIDLGEHGQVEEALGLIADARRVSRMVVGRSRALVELMVGQGMYLQTLAEEAMVRKEAGDVAGFERAVQESRELRLENHEARTGADADAVARLKLASGAVAGMMLPSGLDPSKADPGPERRAEYAVGDQLAAAGWGGVLLLAVVWMAGWAAAMRVRTGRWPAVMFVGWGRLVSVVAVAVGGPVAVYAAYVWAGHFSGRTWGPGYGMGRLMVEYATVGSAVLVLLRVLGDRALARRAREVGLTWDAVQIGWTRAGVGAALVVAAVAYVVVWHALGVGTASERIGWVGYILGAVVAGYGVSWLSGMGGSGGRKLAGWVGPVVVTGMIVLAVVVMGGNYGYQVGRVVAEAATTVSGVVAALAVVALVVKWAMGRGKGATRPVRRFGLSMAPMILAAAVALELVAGMPARLAERHEVRRMEAAGGLAPMDREVERSRLRVIQNRIAGTSSGV